MCVLPLFILLSGELSPRKIRASKYARIKKCLCNAGQGVNKTGYCGNRNGVIRTNKRFKIEIKSALPITLSVVYPKESCHNTTERPVFMVYCCALINRPSV